MTGTLVRTLAFTALPLLAAGCHPAARRSVDVVITVDATAGTATLKCRGSSSDACAVTYIGGRRDAQMAKTAVGETVTTPGITLPSRYCVGPDLPDPAHCDARPLVAGEQIVRQHEERRG